MNHRQHPGVIRSAAVAYAVLLLKRENIGLQILLERYAYSEISGTFILI